MDDGITPSSLPTSYSDFFHESFYFYLAIGMEYDTYWNQDSTLVKAYRKAFEYKQDLKNQELWLQGLYVYEAIADVSPILQAFAKQGTTALPYREKPIDLHPHKEPQTEMEEQQKIANSRVYMEVFMTEFNKKYDKEHGEKGGIEDGRSPGTSDQGQCVGCCEWSDQPI